MKADISDLITEILIYIKLSKPHLLHLATYLSDPKIPLAEEDS